jgi:hypothetical protein
MGSTAERLSTAWLLAGEFGATMTAEQFRAKFMPGASLKTYQNKLSAGLIPEPRRGLVYDVQDVADWWDSLPRKR